jgi:hypothetical protein
LAHGYVRNSTYNQHQAVKSSNESKMATNVPKRGITRPREESGYEEILDRRKNGGMRDKYAELAGSGSQLHPNAEKWQRQLQVLYRRLGCDQSRWQRELKTSP